MQNMSFHIDKVSFVIPVYNEEKTIVGLFEKISEVILNTEIEFYEVVFVDDGSLDGSWNRIEDLVEKNPDHARGIKFRKNFGKSAALNAGFNEVTGDVVFTMDADLQDDPEEIPHFLTKLDEGSDLVSGWRVKRDDPLSKTVPSRIFNRILFLVSGIKLHDFNCGFKAYRREVLEHIDLYGELHRFIPFLVTEFGFKISEIPVRHQPRKHGISKFGIDRYMKGLIDFVAVLCLTRYIHRPGHLFGGIGIFFGLFGAISTGYLIVLWLLGHRPIADRPLLLFGIMAIILSVQLVSFGLLAELSIRNNHPKTSDRFIEKVIGNPKGR